MTAFYPAAAAAANRQKITTEEFFLLRSGEIRIMSCKVPHCHNRRKRVPTICYFNFPKDDPETCQNWLRFCGRTELPLVGEDDSDPIKDSWFICENHFEQRLIIREPDQV